MTDKEKLEVLDILSKHLHIKVFQEHTYLILQTDEIAIIDLEEYEKIKRWLDEKK